MPETMRDSAIATHVLVRVGELTNRTFVLPVVIFFPTSRCNSRCVSCDWWKQSGADDLTLDEIERVADALPALGTRVVAFSGGEPLLRPEVFDAASLFRARGLTLQLLTSGVLLERFAARVAENFTRVYVSIDAADEALYERVRGVNALATVARGIGRLRDAAPEMPIVARATLHRANFRELPRLIEYAMTVRVDGISFLPADVSSMAFGRDRRPDPDALALTAGEVDELRHIVDRTIAIYQDAFASRFVLESPDKLRRLPEYYAALLGRGPFPPVRCNTPWVSVVVEANGAVRPCFFHDPVGNIRLTPFETIVRRNLPAFRASLDVATDPTCTRCVCALKTTWRNAPWIG